MKTKMLLFSILLTTFSLQSAAIGQKLKADELVAKHLDSIGTNAARDAVKNIIFTGDATAKFISTKDQVVAGRLVLASEGPKNFFGLKLNSSRYPGEQFTFDGKKTGVAFVTTTSRSVLGNFVQSFNFLLEDGLLGGILSTSWALRNIAEGKGKVSDVGTRKIEGRECYTMSYSTKGGGDLDVTLYFDKETFRHVRTEYKRIASAAIGRRPEESSGKVESRFKLTEDFSEFETRNGLTLPRKYRLFYSAEGVNGTTEIEWDFVLSEIAFNQKLDPATFSSSNQ
jgi:hypothetical protein